MLTTAQKYTKVKIFYSNRMLSNVVFTWTMLIEFNACKSNSGKIEAIKGIAKFINN